MNEIIKNKIEQIEQYLNELEDMRVESFEEYENNLRAKAIYERYFEKIIESVIDLAGMIIRENGFQSPRDDDDVLKILSLNEILSEELYQSLREAKGMRNFIIHQYEKIDDYLVYTTIEEELFEDIREFLEIAGK